MRRYVVPISFALAAIFGVHLLESSTKDAGSGSEAQSRLDDLLGLRTVPGAFIVGVTSGGPAEKAGFDVCDLIAGFNGSDLRQYGKLQTFLLALRKAAAFSGMDVEVWKPLDAEEGYRRDRVKIRMPFPYEARIGADVTFQVLVMGVVKDGPAHLAGVGVGEFIDQVDDQKVSNLPSLADLDQRVGEILDRNGAVTLTLARWSPVRNSEIYRTRYTTREVRLRVGAAAPDPGE